MWYQSRTRSLRIFKSVCKRAGPREKELSKKGSLGFPPWKAYECQEIPNFLGNLCCRLCGRHAGLAWKEPTRPESRPNFGDRILPAHRENLETVPEASLDSWRQSVRPVECMRPSVQACKEVRLPERTGQAVVVDGVHGKMRHSIVWSKRAHRDTGNHEGLAPGPQFIEPHRPDRSTSRNTRRVQESCLYIDAVGWI